MNKEQDDSKIENGDVFHFVSTLNTYTTAE